MDLTRITYEGRKLYRESHTGNSWMPGDTKLVPSAAADKLLRYVEFKRFDRAPVDEAAPQDATAQTEEQEAAAVVQQEIKRSEEQEKQVMESMLLTVQSMNKNALEEYASKYEVALDKRLAVTKLRAEVSTLIEQFGAR
jgi:hypothetical protein